MKLKSLISDDRIVAFDCAKTKITKGSVIDIPDVCWATNEVQGALNQGLVELVGDPPTMSTGTVMPAERKIKFRNYSGCTLAFETLKAGVGPDECISIPISLLEVREIRDAISSGMIVNTEEPPVPQTAGAAAEIDEVGISDVVAGPCPPATPAATAVAEAPKPRAKADSLFKGSRKTAAASEDTGAFKAKPITRGDDGSDDDLFKPSEVIAPGTKKKKRSSKSDDGDMFRPSEVRLPEPKQHPVDISDIFAKK